MISEFSNSCLASDLAYVPQHRFSRMADHRKRFVEEPVLIFTRPMTAYMLALPCGVNRVATTSKFGARSRRRPVISGLLWTAESDPTCRREVCGLGRRGVRPLAQDMSQGLHMRLDEPIPRYQTHRRHGRDRQCPMGCGGEMWPRPDRLGRGHMTQSAPDRQSPIPFRLSAPCRRPRRGGDDPQAHPRRRRPPSLRLPDRRPWGPSQWRLHQPPPVGAIRAESLGPSCADTRRSCGACWR